MAAALIFVKNPLMPREREVWELLAGERPIDWLLKHHPGGCGGKVWHYHNDTLIDAEADDYLERAPGAGDVVTLAVWPALPAAIGSIIITSLVTAAVGAAVSLGLALLFPKPKAPEAATPDITNQASPVYSVRSRGNLARLGEPVPVVYGLVLQTPDHAMQPHAWYEGSDQFLDQLFVISQGEVDVLEVLVGDTPADLIGSGAVTYDVVPPAQHLQAPGNISLGATAFRENVVTCNEVQGIELNDPNSYGFFRLSVTGQTGRFLEMDLTWRAGLFFQASFGGNISPHTSTFEFDIQEVDANGDLVAGTMMTFEENVTDQTRDPIRRTFTYDMGRSAMWAVRLTRISPQSDEATAGFTWDRAKLRADLAAPLYGNTTLLAVRFKATAGLSDGDSPVRVRCRRRLPAMGSGSPVPTASPADALIDIYTNTTYGARRPLSEVDLATLGPLRTYWAGYEFNAVYTQRTTVWDALSQAVQGVAAAPLPVLGAMSVAQDGRRPVRSMLWTEQNIVKGSFQLKYEFEQTGAADGIEIEYVKPDSFAPAYVRYPTTSVSPDRMNLFGCTNATQAAEFARLQWQRRQKLRRLVNFSTELEGLIPQPGERIAVAHTLPRWGVNGLVGEADGLVVTLDRDLPWDEVPPPHYMLFRDEYSGASGLVQVTEGSAPHQAVLASSPWGPGQDWRTEPTQERTHFSWGDGLRVIKDFTLTAISPKGGAVVAITGVVYDETVYDGTLDFLDDPVPA
jgi:hypothetical protein